MSCSWMLLLDTEHMPRDVFCWRHPRLLLGESLGVQGRQEGSSSNLCQRSLGTSSVLSLAQGPSRIFRNLGCMKNSHHTETNRKRRARLMKL